VLTASSDAARGGFFNVGEDALRVGFEAKLWGDWRVF
jgi:hypothetical protein